MAKAFNVLIYLLVNVDGKPICNYTENRYDDHEELLMDLQSILDVAEKTDGWALLGNILIRPRNVHSICAELSYE